LQTTWCASVILFDTITLVTLGGEG